MPCLQQPFAPRLWGVSAQHSIALIIGLEALDCSSVVLTTHTNTHVHMYTCTHAHKHIYCCVLQGLTYTDAPHAEPEAWAALQSDSTATQVPGGESLDELRERLTAAVLDLARSHPGGCVLCDIQPVWQLPRNNLGGVCTCAGDWRPLLCGAWCCEVSCCGWLVLLWPDVGFLAGLVGYQA